MAEAIPNTDVSSKQEGNGRPFATSSEDTLKSKQQDVTTVEPQSDVKTEQHGSQQLTAEDEDENKQAGDRQIGDQTIGEKPIPAKRCKKKESKVSKLSSAVDDEPKKEQKEEPARENNQEEGMDSGLGSAEFQETLEIDRWKYELLKNEHLIQLPVKITTKENGIVVTGERKKVIKVCNKICELVHKILGTQIKISEDSRVQGFIQSEMITKQIKEWLASQKINCFWELDETHSVINVYVSTADRLQAACDVIRNAFCCEKVGQTEDILFCYLRKTDLWQSNIQKLKEKFDRKAEFIASDNNNEITVFCTEDIKTSVVSKLLQMEKKLVDAAVLKLKSGVYAVLYETLQKSAEVNVIAIPDQHCFILDGEEETVEYVKFEMNKKTLKVKDRKIQINPIIPQEFLKRQAVEKFINDCLKKRNMTVCWQINEIDYTIDVFAYDDVIGQACKIIEQSYQVEKYDFSTNTESLREFQSCLDAIKKKVNKKIEAMFDDQSAIVVCTSDLLPQIKEAQKSCENASITNEVHCKEPVVYEFITKKKSLLTEIEKKHSVSIKPIDDKCMFAIKGKQKEVCEAKDSLIRLMKQKILKDSMHVSEPRFLKFQRGEYETVCREFENFSRVLIQSSETVFGDVTFNVDDNDVILTNKEFKPNEEFKTAVLVASDEIQGSVVQLRKEITFHTINCSASVIRTKLDGGKNKQNLTQLFESIFEEAEKGKFETIVLPLEDLIDTVTAEKFVRYFLRDFQKNICRNAKHIPDIVFQVCNRSKFLTVSAGASEFLRSSAGRESKTIGIKFQEGKLAEAKADVIVNSVGQKLNLSIGSISKSLLKEAGNGLQMEINSKYPKGLDLWNMASTKGHNLLCENIFHLALDGYPSHKANETAKECFTAFGNLIKECLCEMEKKKFKTIAFPVLGTGNLDYKVEDVADIMLCAVEEHNRRNPLTCIQNITIYVYPKGAAETKKVFQERLKQHPKLLSVQDTDRSAVSEEPEKYELVVVGLKDDVVEAKANLLERFKAEDEEAERKAEKAREKESAKAQTDPRPEKNLMVSGKDEGLKTLKAARAPQSEDLSPMNKLLGDVRVEIKHGFIKKLPDTAILKILGFFKVSLVSDGHNSWLKGKLTDLEKARDFLISVVHSTESNQIKTFDITKDLYDLLCSKFGKTQDRFSFDPKSNKLSILEKDEEMINFLKKYKQYQFDELLPKIDTKGNDAENDMRAAEDLKEEKSDFRSVEVFVNSKESTVSILKIAAPDFTILRTFKFKLEVRTGRQKVTKLRHGRAEAEPEIPKHSTHMSLKFATHDTFKASSIKESKGEFTTAEGIKVYVYKHDILKLDVDCIVNAANKEMRHGGGVAKVIARAAGYELERDSRSYVNAHGDLSVGSCCSTSAGNLKYKCVIHTVGPDIKDYRKYKYPQMRLELRQAVRVCFEEAERQNCRSVGMTSISSGVYGVPKPWCAEEYARAVYDYSSNLYRSSLLKEIHFVDISDEMLSEIKKAFQTVLYGTDTRELKEDKDEHANYESTNYRKAEYQQQKLKYPKWYKRDEKWVFELKQDFRVVIYTGNIAHFNTGAIACSQDSNLRSTGGIARALSKMAGPSFQDNLKGKGKKLKTGEVVTTEPGNLNCAAIYHVVSPDFTSQVGQKASDGFLKDYYAGYVNCLCEVGKHGLSKIAIPLFGCGMLKDKVDTLVETFHAAVLSYSSDPKVTNSSLSEIHVINDNEGITHKIKAVFLNYVEATTESPDPGNLDTKSEDHRNREPVDKDRDTGYRAGDKEEMKEDEKVKHPETDMLTEKCPICMDTFDNPKKLSKCGHVFCTDCIEAQFKVTPKCPNCFMVYGVIMGDQPEGKMTSYIDYRTRLPGYEHFSTIVITYDFPDGVQRPDHPQPGTRYRGIRRNGYLPDNEDGRQILKMLKIAFERKLVFTIGSSRTTGKEGVITWNDIHHKTDPRPHSTFGYPDPSYLERVKDELAAKGVTPADIK